MSDDNRVPDLEESWAIIGAAREHARRSVRVDDRLLYATWALAWGLGYLALWLGATDSGRPNLTGALIFGGLLAAAIGVTFAHTSARTRGIGGPEAEINALLGWIWPLAFIGSGLVSGALGRVGLDGEAASIAYNALPCLVVACLYMGMGVALHDRRQFALGGWISVSVGVASMAGTPALYLLMAILGGGGFAVAALAAQRDRRR